MIADAVDSLRHLIPSRPEHELHEIMSQWLPFRYNGENARTIARRFILGPGRRGPTPSSILPLIDEIQNIMESFIPLVPNQTPAATATAITAITAMAAAVDPGLMELDEVGNGPQPQPPPASAALAATVTIPVVYFNHLEESADYAYEMEMNNIDLRNQVAANQQLLKTGEEGTRVKMEHNALWYLTCEARMAEAMTTPKDGESSSMTGPDVLALAQSCKYKRHVCCAQSMSL